jgi:hypothetical protein
VERSSLQAIFERAHHQNAELVKARHEVPFTTKNAVYYGVVSLAFA